MNVALNFMNKLQIIILNKISKIITVMSFIQWVFVMREKIIINRLDYKKKINLKIVKMMKIFTNLQNMMKIMMMNGESERRIDIDYLLIYIYLNK